jgi:hypothetical protein
MPSSFQGTLSVWGPPLSKLVELPSVFVSALSVFREPPSVWGRTLHAFRRMPCSFVGASSLYRPPLYGFPATLSKKHGYLY